jgi:hypothetical protein
VTRRVDPAALVAISIAALALTVAIVASLRPSVRVATSDGCVLLGTATHPELVGPHLVVDCDGRQFGVAIVDPEAPR